MNKVTGLICVYNGQKTLQRALDSLPGEVEQIIVVDDGSTDRTAEIVQSFNLLPLHYIKHDNNLGLGAARQTAIEHCDTGCAVWLDADDEILPGRVKHALPYLENGADFVFDGSQLHLAEGNVQQRLVPEFIRATGGLCWQFARNFIPALAVPVFRVAKAREIGYQPLRNAEDYLFMLEALLAGSKFCFSDFIGYREYASEHSLSRQTAHQHAGRAQSLQHLGYERVRQFLDQHATSFSARYLIQAIYCAQSCQWSSLKACLDRPLTEDQNRLAWYQAFFSGVAYFMEDQLAQALTAFTRATVIDPSRPEAWNNLGVCQHHCGHTANQNFEKALAINTAYSDAKLNMTSANKRLTLVPLRSSGPGEPFS